MGERKSTKPGKVQLHLTDEQKEQVRQVTGKEMETLELAPEQLEERVAPCFTYT